jgi:hypothetical protein
VQFQNLIENQQEAGMNRPILECASFDLPPNLKAHRERVSRTQTGVDPDDDSIPKNGRFPHLIDF